MKSNHAYEAAEGLFTLQKLANLQSFQTLKVWSQPLQADKLMKNSYAEQKALYKRVCMQDKILTNVCMLYACTYTHQCLHFEIKDRVK